MVVPHFSSYYFRRPMIQGFRKAGFDLPADRYFTNLSRFGNTGSASIYLALAELLHSGDVKPGMRILCAVPESGRFSTAYFLLTAV